MRVLIVGAGPAGLYLGYLLGRQRPGSTIRIVEQNPPDATFGFGVVFSDATLDNFEKYDPPSYRRITQEFAYWDDIAVHFRGTAHRVGGNGFCGCSRRTLLLILQERARELGVTILFETDIDDEAQFADADLIVLADGINSRFRDKHIEHFQPQIDLRSNKFAWMGSTRPLDAFTFIFEETEWGPFIAHAYQYEAGRSTWIFETDPDTFKRAGLEANLVADSATTEGILATLLREPLNGKAILVQLYGQENPELSTALQKRGATVIGVSIYSYAQASETSAIEDMVKKILDKEIDAIMFTSATQVPFLFRTADLLDAATFRKRLKKDVVVASVGEVTSRALRSLGVEPHVEPAESKMGPMVKALAEFFEKRKP
jgi:hypothetical protein